MRLSLLFFATSLISACGSSEEGSPENTTEAPVESSSEASTEKDGDAWTLTGDGIPEIDEAGAQKTATGLTIIATKEGTGAAPKEGDVVAVHYHGWLAQDGKQFDSSAKRGDSTSSSAIRRLRSTRTSSFSSTQSSPTPTIHQRSRPRLP